MLVLFCVEVYSFLVILNLHCILP